MATNGTTLARRAIGLLVLACLYARPPERLPQMKPVFADEPELELAAEQVSQP